MVAKNVGRHVADTAQSSHRNRKSATGLDLTTSHLQSPCSWRFTRDCSFKLL
ncbi:hypothetical protein Plhal304r1_c079g0165301 [Plasmopara halstedii]